MPSAPRNPARTRLGRALRLRCLVCGDDRLYAGFLKMRDRCRACGYVHAREGGYWLGAIYVNYGVAVLLAITAHLVMSDVFDVPTWLQMVTLLPAAAAFVVLFSPWSRALWLALDLTCDPPGDEDRLREPPQAGDPRDGDGAG